MEDKTERKLVISNSKQPHCVQTVASHPLLQIDEMESRLLFAFNALEKYHTRCLQYSGISSGNSIDLAILQFVIKQRSGVNPTSICFSLHIEDLHTVNYSLKKLVRHGLLVRAKQGRKAMYSPTDKGYKIYARINQMKLDTLVEQISHPEDDTLQPEDVTDILIQIEKIFTQASQELILS